MAKDILVDDNGDLMAVKGDFQVGESDYQECNSIIVARKGDYKQFPLMGPNVMKYMKGKSSVKNVKRELAIAFALDNKNLESVSIDASGISISVKK